MTILKKVQRPEYNTRTLQAIGSGNGKPLEIGWRYGLIYMETYSSSQENGYSLANYIEYKC